MRNLALLSRRERQIMDILFRRGHATVEEVRNELPEAPSAAAVRAALLRLEERGYTSKKQDGQRNVFAPSAGESEAKRSALRHVVETFFQGSMPDVVAAALEEGEFTDEELRRYEQLIEAAKKREEDR